jgi:hypothetical protein
LFLSFLGCFPCEKKRMNNRRGKGAHGTLAPFLTDSFRSSFLGGFRYLGSRLESAALAFGALFGSAPF